MSDGRDVPHLQAGAGPHEDREAVDIWLITPVPFVRYDAATGEIHGYGRMGFGHIEAEHVETRAILPGDGGLGTHYVDVATQTIREKTACPARLEGQVLHDLPVPCRIAVSQFGVAPVVYEWSDETCALEFDHPGFWNVRVSSVPHRDASLSVTVDG